MDRISAARRSRNMSRIRAKDTAPEMRVRQLLHGLGYRYRIHVASLPGKPDIVFPRRRSVLLIHGCFWHRHPGCRFAAMPKSRADFWLAKFRANVDRDERVRRVLNADGWKVLVIWECETRNLEVLTRKLVDFLGSAKILLVTPDV